MEEADSSTKNETISIEDDQIWRTQLKMQFHSTIKGDHETIESFVRRLKAIANSLAAINSPISDPDMVLQLLAGLPSQYLPLQKTITSRWPLPDFKEACSMAHMQEVIFLQDQEEQISSDPRGVGANQSSAFCSTENFDAAVDAVSSFSAATMKEADSSTKNETISIEDDQIWRTQRKMLFHSSRKGDRETIESFVRRLKSIANSLEAINSPISDPDMVLQLLAGLPNQYMPLQKTITSRWPFPDFEEACSMAHMQEIIFLQDQEEQISSDPGGVGANQSAFFTRENLYAAADTVCSLSGAASAIGVLVSGGFTVSVGTMCAAVGAINIGVSGGRKIWQALARK